MSNIANLQCQLSVKVLRLSSEVFHFVFVMKVRSRATSSLGTSMLTTYSNKTQKDDERGGSLVDSPPFVRRDVGSKRLTPD